ncbi:helix-turn-helix domain-containing protein [Paenibacillus odorifer]|nr:helix-turn-helix transcriptional regulator [Paenibacillus odorifer]
MGISQGRLSEIEQGKTKPSAETLNELRKKFNVDLNRLSDENN